MSGLSQFDERSDSLRQEVLVPSGGWLGEVVVLISELCGIWDIFVLMTFFVVAWVVIRTTSCEVSVVLGLIFDLSIPLQYQNNEALGKRHDQHLRDYWPIFTMGSLVVGATYFLAYGELFTLVVCVKTTICLVVWLSKRPDGSKVQLSSGSGSSTASRSSSQPPSSRSRSSTADSPPATPRSSSRGYKPSSKMPVDARFPDADKRLFEAGYTDAECREGMIRHMLGESKQANAEKNLKRWIKTAKEPGMIAKKTEQYRKEAALRRPLQQGTSGSGGAGRSSGSGGSGGSSGSGRGGSGPPPGKVMLLPTAQLEAIEKALKRSKYSKQTDKIMKSIVAAKTPDELKEIIKEWNLLAMNVAPEALRPRDNLTGKLSSSWVKDVRRILVNADDGLGVPPDVAEEMVKHLYAQPDEATAEALVKQWATLAAAPRGKQRTAAIAAMMKPYAERVVDLKYGKIWRSE